MKFITFLKTIALKLPLPIRIILKKPWVLWCSSVVWDKELLQDINRYFGIKEKDAKFLLASGGRLNAFFWKYSALQGNQQAFYQLTPFYVFELAFWHMTRYQRMFRASIVELSRGQVLDFGGGIGDLSLRLSQKKINVTYADVKGQTYAFAKYLFSVHGANIVMLDLAEQSIAKQYDTIICLDVIEHLDNKREMLDTMIRHLLTGGRLIITNIEFNEMDQYQYEHHPMHIPFNFDAKKYLLDNGLEATQYPWLFIKSTS